MVGYARFNQLIAVSAAKSKDSVDKRFHVTRTDLSVRFSDYVKSQVHLNISSDLCNQPLSVYANAYRFITGRSKSRDSALTALGQFYSDMANFLIKNPFDINLHILVDCSITSSVSHYNIDEVKNLILRAVYNSSDAALRDFEFANIIDHVDSLSDLTNKINSYSIAAVLLRETEFVKRGQTRQIIIGGMDNENKGKPLQR